MPAVPAGAERAERRSGRRVGFHVSVAGGLPRALARARELGADVLQIFPSNPRGWRLPDPDLDAEAELRAGLEAARHPLFLHAPYLVNLAAPDPGVHGRSVDTLAFALERGARLGAIAVVVHAGSALDTPRADGIRRAARTLVDLLERIEGPDIAVELTAGGGVRAIARTLPDATDLLDAVEGHPRVRICLDSCHLWQAGVDWTSQEARAAFRAQVKGWGAGRVPVLHANDAREPFGAGRDHHAAIGDGTIGSGALGELLRLPEFRGVPVVLETPGGVDQNRDDIAAVRELVASRARARPTPTPPA